MARPKTPTDPADALCCLEWDSADPSSILWRSRGSTGSVTYKIDLGLLLQRAGALQLDLKRVAVDTRTIRHLPLKERTIYNGRPLDLSTFGPGEADAFRAKLGSRGAAVGRPPGAKGGGNTTRSLRLYFTRPLIAGEALALDAAPRAGELVRRKRKTRTRGKKRAVPAKLPAKRAKKRAKKPAAPRGFSQNPEERRLQIRDLVRDYFNRRAKAMGAGGNHDVYTRDEWRRRKEKFGNNYDVTLAAEASLNHALNYEPPEVAKLEKWLTANGLWYDQGYSWTWHFYPQGEHPPAD